MTDPPLSDRGPADEDFSLPFSDRVRMRSVHLECSGTCVADGYWICWCTTSKLQSVVSAVLDLHRVKHGFGRGVTTEHCATCSEKGIFGFRRPVAAPCPTVRKVAAILGVQ